VRGLEGLPEPRPGPPERGMAKPRAKAGSKRAAATHGSIRQFMREAGGDTQVDSRSTCHDEREAQDAEDEQPLLASKATPASAMEPMGIDMEGESPKAPPPKQEERVNLEQHMGELDAWWETHKGSEETPLLAPQECRPAQAEAAKVRPADAEPAEPAAKQRRLEPTSEAEKPTAEEEKVLEEMLGSDFVEGSVAKDTVDGDNDLNSEASNSNYGDILNKINGKLEDMVKQTENEESQQDAKMGQRDQKRKEELEKCKAAGGNFEMRSSLGQRFRRDYAADEKMLQEWKELNTQAGRAAFKKEWCDKQLAQLEAGKKSSQSWKFVDARLGEYVTFGVLAVRYGFQATPRQALRAATCYASQAARLGGKWIEYDSMGKVWTFLHLRKQYKEELSKAWEMYQVARGESSIPKKNEKAETQKTDNKQKAKAEATKPKAKAEAEKDEAKTGEEKTEEAPKLRRKDSTHGQSNDGKKKERSPIDGLIGETTKLKARYCPLSRSRSGTGHVTRATWAPWTVRWLGCCRSVASSRWSSSCSTMPRSGKPTAPST